MKYARTVATIILKANPSADVKIVELPDLPETGDFVDWYDEQKKNGVENSAVMERFVLQCKSAERVDEIKKMKELLDCGAITQEEFNAFKRKTLGI